LKVFIKLNVQKKFLRKIDITKLFKKIDLEKRDSSFIPDLLLKSEKEKIYVEIAVTHKCSDEKLILK